MVNPWLAHAAASAATGLADAWQGLLRLIVGLVVIVPLVYFVTRLYGRAALGVGSRRALVLIDTLPLGANRAVCLVKVGERLLIVGATAQQVSLLAELSDPEEVARLTARFEEGHRTGMTAWQKELARARERLGAKARERSEEGEGSP